MLKTKPTITPMIGPFHLLVVCGGFGASIRIVAPTPPAVHKPSTLKVVYLQSCHGPTNPKIKKTRKATRKTSASTACLFSLLAEKSLAAVLARLPSPCFRLRSKATARQVDGTSRRDRDGGVNKICNVKSRTGVGFKPI